MNDEMDRCGCPDLPSAEVRAKPLRLCRCLEMCTMIASSLDKLYCVLHAVLTEQNVVGCYSDCWSLALEPVGGC